MISYSKQMIEFTDCYLLNLEQVEAVVVSVKFGFVYVKASFRAF